MDFQKQKTNVPAPRRRGALALSEAEEPEERPPLRLVPGPEEALEQEVVLAWQAYQRLEPDAELTPKRKRLLVAAIRRRGPDVRRSFEGRAGAPSTKLDLLPTLPGLLEDERISKGVALRRLPGWKDPNAVRPKPAEPPPAAPALSAGHVTAILASLPEAPWRTKRRPGTKQEER